MIKPILQLGNELLRKKASRINNFDNKSLENLVRDLSDTLNEAQKRFCYGRGIAAPQIGESKRIALIGTPSFRSPLVNPKIINASTRKFEIWDSCFSFNTTFFVLIDRHYKITVEYFDMKGERHTVEAENKLSELLQHEIDHLDGILVTDRMKHRKGIMMRSEWIRNFKTCTCKKK
ncbi:MAG: peptide deformylase [Candidatus Bathyarchaeota archaeon]|nr:MAG: peptide deformylase [Candidatus Bathyarchaeota archaeon]